MKDIILPINDKLRVCIHQLISFDKKQTLFQIRLQSKDNIGWFTPIARDDHKLTFVADDFYTFLDQIERLKKLMVLI